VLLKPATRADQALVVFARLNFSHIWEKFLFLNKIWAFWRADVVRQAFINVLTSVPGVAPRLTRLRAVRRCSLDKCAYLIVMR
jgi:hypothetical protein